MLSLLCRLAGVSPQDFGSSLDSSGQRFDTGVDAFCVFALAKPRDDLLANHATRICIGDRPLQTISNLDAHLAIVSKDEEHQPLSFFL